MRNFMIAMAMVGVTGFASAGSAEPPPCGTTVNAGETLVLDGELDACTGVGLIVNSGAKIDMAAHQINCTGSGTIGLQLLGSGIKVYNGQIRGCDIGVSLEGEGGHSLTHLYIRDASDTAVHILSSGNKISSNVIVGRPYDDLTPTNDLLVAEAGANKNTIKGNLFVDTGGDSIDLRSNGNKVSGNFSVNAYDSAIDENDDEANKNSIKKNVAFRSGWSGVELGGYASKATGNFVVGSGEYGIDIESSTSALASGQSVSKNVVMSSGNFDMSDANTMCVPDVWKKNVFITRDQTCIQ